MANVNKFPSGMHSKFQALINAITVLLPSTVPSPTGSGQQTFSGFDFSVGQNGVSQAGASNGCRITFEIDPTGQKLTITAKQSDQGQNNPYGPADGGPAGHYLRSPAIVIDGSYMP